MRDDALIFKLRVRCYDNGGKTADRYTVVFMNMPRERDGAYPCLGMSNAPTHPQGVSMWSSAMVGRHLGRRVAFAALPAHIRRHVRYRVLL